MTRSDTDSVVLRNRTWSELCSCRRRWSGDMVAEEIERRELVLDLLLVQIAVEGRIATIRHAF